MGTGGVEKAGAQKNSPLSINEKTKKKKKTLVRVSTYQVLFLQPFSHKRSGHCLELCIHTADFGNIRVTGGHTVH